MDLYDATVPPLKRLSKAVPRLIDRLEDAGPLSARLAKDGFTGGEHFCCALGFVARTVLPLLGRDVPELPFDNDAGLIVALAEDMTFMLDTISRHDFDDAVHREITHIAGEATLTQNGQDYALLFGLPNAQFHLTLGYATLRAAGAQVGKADLDGYHIYTTPQTHH
ncbi:DUF1993 family protein [uncultured Tateyamaria sp.]|uniref:DUF1993 family protein n=1 Tax=uncultured Tateyamaria sp. TaxID=455651 RepID=UPI00261EF8BD|nr:DUF1993 family protein [uncultured Tateyamaria sp.]